MAHHMVLRSFGKKLKKQEEILAATKKYGFLFDNHRVYRWDVLWRQYQKNVKEYNRIQSLYKSLSL